MRESKVENHLVAEVQKLGGKCPKVTFLGTNGAPDRLVILPFFSPFVETKRPNGKAKDHQIRRHNELRLAGHTVLILDSIEKVDAMIKDYKKTYLKR